MSAKRSRFQAAIQRALDGALLDPDANTERVLYIFMGRLSGALDPLDPVLAAQITALAHQAAAAPLAGSR